MLNKIYGWTAKLRQKLSEKGQGMVEYAMILAAVAIIAVIAIWTGGGTDEGATKSLKTVIESAFGNASTAVERGNTETKNNTPAAKT